MSSEKKRKGAGSTSQTTKLKFSSGSEIRQSLRNGDEKYLIETLTALRNQLTIRADEVVASTDARLVLAKQWLEFSPGADDIFQLIKKETQASALVLAISVLSCLVTLLSTHYIYHPLCQPILKRLLTSQWMRKIESNISGGRTDLALVSLKLLNAMANFAAGKEQKAVFDAFAWDSKALTKLMFMRRKGKPTDGPDMLLKPDIRTLTIQLIMSFLSPNTASSIKTAFLEQHRDIFVIIFKGLYADPYPVVRYVLETCWTGIWQDPKIKRTLKIGIFGEMTLQQIIKLYDRTTQEAPVHGGTPANLVHHFMLAICTHRGVGICFSDHGWYPRKTEEDANSDDEDADGETRKRGGKIFNKILANILKVLKTTEDPLQRELALRILEACPELVSGFWQGSPLTVEPRLSTRWLSNVAFLGSVVSLPIPANSFVLPPGSASTSSSTALYRPQPPPLSAIMENIMPSLNLKSHLTKGLQSPVALVQHSTAVTLVKCLQKCEAVLLAFRDVVKALEEDEINGQWAKRIHDIEREMRKRLPDFQVIVAFSHQKTTPQQASGQPVVSQPVKTALLAEIQQRLLLLYHRCVPSVVAETSYDVAKSLQSFDIIDTSDEASGADASTGLDDLRQLHILHMLRETDRFELSSKPASASHFNAFVLMKMYIKSRLPTIQHAVIQLFRHAWAHSLLFQHDLDEIHIWLECLPRGVRSPNAQSPDGIPLTDELEAVAAFLDDCIQRCTKTPYRYLDDINALATVQADGDVQMTEEYLDVSPLLATVLEQFAAKVRTSLLSPSDTLAVVTYIRMLAFKLRQKQSNILLLEVIATQLYATIESQSPSVLLTRSRGLQNYQAIEASSAITEFLDQVEKTPIPDSEKSRKIQGYELIDWLRLVDAPLQPKDVRRLLKVIESHDKAILTSLYQHMKPGTGLLWATICDSNEEIPDGLSFDWLLLDCSKFDLQSTKCREALVKTLKTEKFSVALRNYATMVLHLLDELDSTEVHIILNILGDIMQHAKQSWPKNEWQTLKTSIFAASTVFKAILYDDQLDESSITALKRLLEICIDKPREDDRELLSDTSRHWATVMKHRMSTSETLKLSPLVYFWVDYMESTEILAILELAILNIRDRSSEFAVNFPVPFLQRLLQALNKLPETSISQWLRSHVSDMILLRHLIPNTPILDDVIQRGVESSLPLGYDGYMSSSKGQDLQDILVSAEFRWMNRSNSLVFDSDIRELLKEESWTDGLSEVVVRILYKSPSSLKTFWTWVTQEADVEWGNSQKIIAPLHAFFDCISTSLVNLDSPAPTDHTRLSCCFSWMVDGLFDQTLIGDTRTEAIACVASILCLLEPSRPQSMRVVRDHLQRLTLEELPQNIIELAIELSTFKNAEIDLLVTEVVDHSLQWFTRRLSDTQTFDIDGRPAIAAFSSLVESRQTLKPYFSETIFAAAIKPYLEDSTVMKLLNVVFKRTVMKPVDVNRYLQSILHHDRLLLAASPREVTPSRKHIASLLKDMFYRHPLNTCQATHVEPLINLYGGSLSIADRYLLSIFQLFETQRKLSMSSMLSSWSCLDDSRPSSCLEALVSLDANIVFRTCLNFPVHLTINSCEHIEERHRPQNDHLYDPVFVLLLMGSAILEDPPQNTSVWLEFFQKNVVSLAIRALSSVHGNIRSIALAQLGAVRQSMKIADLQEKEQVIYILNLLRDLIPPHGDNVPPRISSFMTLLLAHSLRGVFYPSNFVYPITARFLLQRPVLDPSDVPLLYGMLYSTSDDWRKERFWIVRFLADSIHSLDDWQVFKRRHSWDLLATLFQSSQDHALRHGVLELLGNITCHPQATTSLVLKSFLLQWIETQLLNLKREESIPWAKIIENIITVVDPSHLEQATLGEWRRSLLRSLILLLSGADMQLLHQISQILARLALQPLPTPTQLVQALSTALMTVKDTETNIKTDLTDVSDVAAEDDTSYIYPPHRGQETFQLKKLDEFILWGKTVELLWQVAMSCDAKEAWNALTYRLLVWRSIAGSEANHLSEWARKETIRCIHSS